MKPLSSKTTKDIVNNNVIESKIGWDFALGGNLNEEWIRKSDVRDAVQCFKQRRWTYWFKNSPLCPVCGKSLNEMIGDENNIHLNCALEQDFGKELTGEGK